MIKRVAVMFAVLLAAGSVRAEECPLEAPDDSAVKRKEAKRWFAKGEVAARGGDDVAALKAYQCSLMFVPHGFTAYNIAQIAEKTGDLELSISSYGQYLLLVPDAKDAVEVNERVDQLRERVAKVREAERAQARNKADPSIESLLDKPREPPKPKVVVPQPRPEVSEQSNDASIWSSKTTAWIVTGSGGVLLLGGVLSNILARGQMETCNSEYTKNGNQVTSAAESACSNAKPLAYLSYGLIGVGTAAAVTGAVLLITRPSEDSGVSFTMLPEGGLTLRWSGRY
jgi:hypothetical protein